MNYPDVKHVRTHPYILLCTTLSEIERVENIYAHNHNTEWTDKRQAALGRQIGHLLNHWKSIQLIANHTMISYHFNQTMGPYDTSHFSGYWCTDVCFNYEIYNKISLEFALNSTPCIVFMFYGKFSNYQIMVLCWSLYTTLGKRHIVTLVFVIFIHNIRATYLDISCMPLGEFTQSSDPGTMNTKYNFLWSILLPLL